MHFSASLHYWDHTNNWTSFYWSWEHSLWWTIRRRKILWTREEERERMADLAPFLPALWVAVSRWNQNEAAMGRWVRAGQVVCAAAESKAVLLGWGGWWLMFALLFSYVSEQRWRGSGAGRGVGGASQTGRHRPARRHPTPSQVLGKQEATPEWGCAQDTDATAYYELFLQQAGNALKFLFTVNSREISIRKSLMPTK